MIKHVFGCVCLFFLFASNLVAGSPPWSRIKTTETTCTQVISGDMIEITLEGRPQKIKLAGVETVRPQEIDGKLRAFDDESQQLLSQLALGKLVYVELTEFRDSVQNQIGWVWLGRPDYLMLQAEVARCGYGRAAIATPVRYLRGVIEAEKEARMLKTGCWSSSR